MSTARKGYFGTLLEPGLSEIFYNAYDEVPTLYQDLYKMLTSEKGFEKDLGIGAFGDFPEFDGTVEYDRPYEGYSKVYEFPEYAKGFQITRKLYDDDDTNTINSKPEQLGTRAARKKEQHAAAVFNNAFTATYTGPDGVSLCDDEHPAQSYEESGGSEGVQYRSNVGTLALSHSALQTTKNLMRDTRDDRNFRIGIVPDLLLVPPEKEELAWQLIQSPLVVNSSDENPNIHQGRYKLMVWDELTNEDAWFLIDSRYMKMFLKWFDRVPLEFAMTEDFDTLVAKYRAYMRYECGWSDWVWIYGNDAS